jgi:hypothetical protein
MMGFAGKVVGDVPEETKVEGTLRNFEKELIWVTA